LADARASERIRPDIRNELSRHPAGKRARLLTDHVRLLLARILKCPPDQLARESALGRIGLDSLAAVELQLTIDREFGVALPMVALLGGQTLASIGAMMARELTDVQERPATPAL